jgi:hypothetical protein
MSQKMKIKEIKFYVDYDPKTAKPTQVAVSQINGLLGGDAYIYVLTFNVYSDRKLTNIVGVSKVTNICHRTNTASGVPVLSGTSTSIIKLYKNNIRIQGGADVEQTYIEMDAPVYQKIETARFTNLYITNIMRKEKVVQTVWVSNAFNPKTKCYTIRYLKQEDQC